MQKCWIQITIAILALVIASLIIDQVQAMPQTGKDLDYGDYTVVEAKVSGDVSLPYVYGPVASVSGYVHTDLSTIDPTKDWGLIVYFCFTWKDLDHSMHIVTDVYFFPEIDEEGEGVIIQPIALPDVVFYISSEGRTGCGYVVDSQLIGFWDTRTVFASLPYMPQGEEIEE